MRKYLSGFSAFFNGNSKEVLLHSVNPKKRPVEYLDFKPSPKEDYLYMVFHEGDRPKTIMIQVDLTSYGFWRSVAWGPYWTQEEKTTVAEIYLGGYFDSTGNLQPLPTALQRLSRPYSEEKVLSYLRSRQGLDYEFLHQHPDLDDIAMSYVQERMGLRKYIEPKDFKHLCQAIVNTSFYGHPVDIIRLRKTLSLAFDTTPYKSTSMTVMQDIFFHLPDGSYIQCHAGFGEILHVHKDRVSRVQPRRANVTQDCEIVSRLFWVIV